MKTDRSRESSSHAPAAVFLRASAGYLRDTYLPRIRTALEVLPADDLWWSPHARTNGVGHLLLHLEGNVRQWIVSGIGGAPDHRDRASEFAPRERPPAGELLERLEATVNEACVVIEGLTAEDLLRQVVIQGYDNLVLEAIFHVVEHFAWHTGQIASIAKQRAGERHGLAYYDEARVNAARNPPAAS